MRSIVACLLASALTVPCLAQAVDSQPYTLQVKSQIVLLDAVVTYRKTGAPLRDLQPSDFVLKEDGEPQAIRSLSQDKAPLSIALLFDTTDTVAPVLDSLALHAQAILSGLRPDDEVAIFTFSNRAQLVQPFTRSLSRLVTSISEAAAVHDVHVPTFLHEDLFTVTQYVAQAARTDSRRVELWFTDGTSHEQPPNLHSAAQATAELTRSGITFSLIQQRSGLTYSDLRHPPLGFRLGEFQHYADFTGGPLLESTPANAAAQMTAMLSALRMRYTLGYVPAGDKKPGTLCRLSLSLSPAFFAAHPELRPKEILLRTRQSYIR